MSIFIPVWLIFIAKALLIFFGVVAGALILFFAYLGVILMWTFKDGIYPR